MVIWVDSGLVVLESEKTGVQCLAETLGSLVASLGFLYSNFKLLAIILFFPLFWSTNHRNESLIQPPLNLFYLLLHFRELGNQEVDGPVFRVRGRCVSVRKGTRKGWTVSESSWGTHGDNSTKLTPQLKVEFFQKRKVLARWRV